ncbi:hypothetical protein PRK78_002460 [Emydomyces testavorans]|uniref:Fungal lipase-type domain-containing protein n=1 Tax=Emydomyces testavorans TaxID=2070801 RepID=A0AAF0DE92_9EURO|nr:hypothetical protein PRK78_002460 [Emydomyces testavorans]
MKQARPYLSAASIKQQHQHQHQHQQQEQRSTSRLVAPEPFSFHPPAWQSPNGSDSKASLSPAVNDESRYAHGAVRDLQELRALYVPFISSEEDLTPSSTTTTNYVPTSPTASVPSSSHARLSPASPISTTSPAGSVKRLSLPSRFAPPPRISTLSKSSLPLSPVFPTSKTGDNDPESLSEFSPDFSGRVLEQFEKLINSIDMQAFTGRERDLVMVVGPRRPRHSRSLTSPDIKDTKPKAAKRPLPIPSGRQINFSSTVYNYGNSQLPSNLPPLRVYVSPQPKKIASPISWLTLAFSNLPIWPMLCLAAQFSQRAYSMPSESERETFVEADVLGGTNAMVIKSVALDHIDLVVLSIRGTNYTSFKDWASDMTLEPEPATGFLDSPDHLCHAGFLGVARQMIKPVSLRLRQIIEESPARSAASLVITGHSTGGAIASLLYAHMLSQTVKSDLITLRHSFSRIHCITFGAPPVSTPPLNKPSDKEFQNWLFFSILNEGDPVTLAERGYIRSLIDLYHTPPPAVRPTTFLSRKFAFFNYKDRKKFDKRKSTTAVWSRPPPGLSLPGRLIVLRGSEGKDGKQYAAAYLTRNEELAGVVFGDVMMHSMTLYQRRVEILATEAAWAKKDEGF